MIAHLFEPARGRKPARCLRVAQATAGLAQPCRQLHRNLGPVLENRDLANLTAAATLGKGDQDRRLVHIQPDRR